MKTMVQRIASRIRALFPLRPRLRSIVKLITSPDRYKLVTRSPFAERLDALLREPGFFFIQVGAHDGVRFDDLYGKVTAINCSGIVIEPLPRYFRRLKANYEDYPGVVPLNVAVHPTLEKIELFHVIPERADQPWAHGIGSANPRHHALIATAQECISSTTVPAMSLAAIISRHEVKRIDLLQIDVEGFDLQVLEMIPFERIRPRLIKFEITHLDEASRIKAFNLLGLHGYKISAEGEDAIAILG
jgi:FkbM family methyltransferase